MRIAAIIVFVLVPFAILSSGNVVLEAMKRSDPSQSIAGYAVGAFLFPLVLFILGLVLWNKGKTDGKGDADRFE